MPTPTLFRDSFVGQIIYLASGRRLLRHIEEQPTYTLPDRLAKALAGSDTQDNVVCDRSSPDSATLPDRSKPGSFADDKDQPTTRVCVDPEKGDAFPVEQQEENPFLVNWYGPDDPENPHNWSTLKKGFITFNICLLTFSVYIGSAIFSPGILDIAHKFGVSEVAASLGITMFVLGYGTGPMILAPLSEVPQLGRTSVYIISLAIFVVVQVPTALCKNLGALLPLRFLAGFVGSPALATGVASMIDLWRDEWVPVFVGLWGLASVCGPVFGPVIGGFAAQAKGWTWTIWVLLWLSGTTCVWLSFSLPETSAHAILHRRAARLRRLTQDARIRSQSEIDAEHFTVAEIARITLVRPFILGFREPIVIFQNSHIALVYAVLYVYISSIDVVFIEKHHFNLGENGLTFLGGIVGGVITFALYLVWLAHSITPRIRRGEKLTPESRLPPGMLGGILLAISLFMFGWTAAASIPWILPVIAIGIFTAAIYLLLQSALVYLTDCYPHHIASVMAGNNFFRSMLGASFPVFSHAFLDNLGVGPALSVLGGVACLMVPIPFVLYRYGPTIRTWSRWAN